MSDDRNLPDELSSAALVPLTGMPVALQIFFNEAMFQRCKQISIYMSQAKGFVPAHLSSPQACLAVISRALTWKLDPFAVAQSTYEVSGKIGYYGSLCQAVIENSGRLVGGVKYAHFGDWDKVQRRFEIGLNDNGNRVPKQLWTDDDEIGIGVTVSAQIKGEAEPRILDFHLQQAYPRYSTLWITDPKTQIQYTAVRRFGTSVAPTLFMGVPFDREDIDDWADLLKDVTPSTPRPRRSEARQTPRETSSAGTAGPDASDGSSGETQETGDHPIFSFNDEAGVIHEFDNPSEAARELWNLLSAGATARGEDGIEAAWENGAELISTLREHGRDELADDLRDSYARMLEEARGKPASPGDPAGTAEGAGAAARTPPAAGRHPRACKTHGIIDCPQPECHARDAGEDGAPEVPSGGTGGPTPEGRTTAPAMGTAEPEVKAANPESSPFFIPYENNDVQAWYSLARTLVMKMVREKAPKDDFARFREVNNRALIACRGGFRSWFKQLDDQIVRGERGL